jgi:hypothetical protein
LLLLSFLQKLWLFNLLAGEEGMVRSKRTPFLDARGMGFFIEFYERKREVKGLSNKGQISIDE